MDGTCYRSPSRNGRRACRLAPERRIGQLLTRLHPDMGGIRGFLDMDVVEPQVIEIYGSRNLSLIFGGVEPSEVQMLLPVGRHRAGRTRHGLIQRMAPRLGELRAAREIASPVVVEPILAGLEALDHGMSRLPAVCAGVLARRVVTAADVAARRATPEVKPPAGLGAGQTLCAPTTARWHIGVDVVG